MEKQTVFVVLHTTLVRADIAGAGSMEFETDPVVVGVFSSYEAANDFLDPLLDERDRETGLYTVIERELQ